jgi:hypothetical protein
MSRWTAVLDEKLAFHKRPQLLLIILSTQQNREATYYFTRIFTYWLTAIRKERKELISC